MRKGCWLVAALWVVTGQAWALDGRCGGEHSGWGVLADDFLPLLVFGVVGGAVGALFWLLLIRLMRWLSKGRLCKARSRAWRAGCIIGGLCFILGWLLLWGLSNVCF